MTAETHTMLHGNAVQRRGNTYRTAMCTCGWESEQQFVFHGDAHAAWMRHKRYREGMELLRARTTRSSSSATSAGS